MGANAESYLPIANGLNSVKPGQQGVTVSWYYRPEQVSDQPWLARDSILTNFEQTFHSSLRKFWENEVFKTSESALPIAKLVF